jgi:hypothetical protein
MLVAGRSTRSISKSPVVVVGLTHTGAEDQWNRLVPLPFPRMAKKIVIVDVLEEGDERFLRKTHADGSEERKPIVKEARKKRPRRIDWSRKLSTGLKRGF